MTGWTNAVRARPASSQPRPHATGRSAMLWGIRVECGNPECSRTWLAFLKDRRRPIFERNWGCSAACIQAMVQIAIRREGGDADAHYDGTRHRHRLPLGLVLLNQGWITNQELQRALDRQRRAGKGRIGTWLIEECGLPKDRVTRGLSMQWGCPVLPIDGFDPVAMALVVPKLLVEQLQMVPLRIAAERILYLAFADGLDASAAFAVERMSGLKVESGLLDSAQWNAARQSLSECEFVNAAFEPVATAQAMSRKIASALTRIGPRASRLVRVHRFYWLRMWLETGAMRAGDGGVPATREDVVDRIYTLEPEP